MATVHEIKTVTTSRNQTKRQAAGPRRWRWTAHQYRRLDQLGFFAEHHVELVNGDLIELTTTPPHDTSVALTCATLRTAFGFGFVVREEMNKKAPSARIRPERQ